MTTADDHEHTGADPDSRGGYVDLAAELTRATLSTTERLLAHFVRQGEVAAEHAERLIDEVVARSVEGSGALARLVRSEVEHAVERAGYVRAGEVEALRREVEVLRTRLAAREGEPTAAPPPTGDAGSGVRASGGEPAGGGLPEAPK